MDRFNMLLIVIIAVGSFLVLIMPFSRQFKDAPQWMRCALFLAGVAGLLRALFDFYLASANPGHISPSRYWTLYSFRSFVGGIAVGILVTVSLSGEFWRRGLRFPTRKV